MCDTPPEELLLQSGACAMAQALPVTDKETAQHSSIVLAAATQAVSQCFTLLPAVVVANLITLQNLLPQQAPSYIGCHCP